ncbi:MAG TPA: hypothetical protein VIF14_16870 [Alphaproteobacteria bacterium]|jgi:hypothetical protein
MSTNLDGARRRRKFLQDAGNGRQCAADRVEALGKIQPAARGRARGISRRAEPWGFTNSKERRPPRDQHAPSAALKKRAIAFVEHIGNIVKRDFLRHSCARLDGARLA